MCVGGGLRLRAYKVCEVCVCVWGGGLRLRAYKVCGAVPFCFQYYKVVLQST